MVRGGGFAKYLQDWVRNDGQLSQESASVLAEVRATNMYSSAVR